MVSVNKNLNDLPLSLRESRCTDSLTQIISEGNVSSIDEAIYKGKYNTNSEGFGDVQQQLKDLYHNKCAYCESYTYKPRIEHYRPKGRVSDYNFQTRKFQKVRNHNGYYWLCYEWTNLVPSCHFCNSVENGKSDRFPIMPTSQRAFLPSDSITNEQPYLLQPEIDNPENYLGFQFNIGEVQIIGLDTTNRGEITILVCNLNRGDLKANWFDRFEEYLQNITDAFYLFSQDANELVLNNHISRLLAKILRWANNPEKQYRLLNSYIYRHFKAIFCPPILNEFICPKLFEIYDEFVITHPID
jgi:uncharacterized protein (TIGR02646 family)